MANEEKKVEKNEDGEVIGHGNYRQDMREQLYKKADEEREESEDFVDVADEDHDKTVEVVEEEKEEVVAAPAKRKFKVNGKEIELSEDEIAERVSKSEAADQKFQEAARMKKEAEELTARVPVKPAPEESVEEDDAALARAIQMGSEEEAVAAIKKLKRPSVKSEDVLRVVESRFSFEAQKQKFLSEYKDVMDDPKWKEIVLDREEYLAFKGKPGGYERFKEAGEYARTLRAETTPQQADTQRKLERKASLKSVPAANVRQAPAQEEDKDESTSDVIASMAKARQGRAIGGGNV